MALNGTVKSSPPRVKGVADASVVFGTCHGYPTVRDEDQMLTLWMLRICLAERPGP